MSAFRAGLQGPRWYNTPMILTDDQRKELAGAPPIRAIDPETKQEYVLVPAELYERVRPLVAETAVEELLPEVPPGIQRSKEAFLRDLWPSLTEIRDAMQSALKPEVFRRLYRDFADQNPKWNEIPSSTGEVYLWDEKSDYIHEPPFFKDFSMEVGKIDNIVNARPLGIFGDSVTTDHISPAGAIKATSPAGEYLKSRGIDPTDFNSYGSRRGNDPRAV